MDKKLRERKYMEAAKMRSQGYSLRVIGEKVGLGTTTVWKMLRNFDLDSELDDTNEVEKMSNRNRAGKDTSKSREQQLMEEKQKNAEAELAWLKSQINPHFLMNTLNNIHALVDIDPEKAKDEWQWMKEK